MTGKGGKVLELQAFRDTALVFCRSSHGRSHRFKSCIPPLYLKLPKMLFSNTFRDALKDSECDSHYHAWLVNNRGEKIDCSEFPVERYKRSFVWEPHDAIPEVGYTSLPDDSADVLA